MNLRNVWEWIRWRRPSSADERLIEKLRKVYRCR